MRPLSRRTVLRGLGGIVALPLLEAMAQPAPPKRMVLVFSANGTIYPNWLPTGSESNFTLSPILAPLQPYQGKLLVLGNVAMTSAQNGPGDQHEKGIAHLWTATEMQSGNLFGSAGWAGGISVDQQVAQSQPSQTALSSLELGVQVPGLRVYDRMIYSGAGQPLPPMLDPQAVFDRLFGSFDADPTVVARRKAQRQSVLDAVQAEMNALRPRISTQDRARLDQHLTSIREIETRLQSQSVPGQSCMKPNAPAPLNLIDPSNYETIGHQMMDLLAMALACDLTRLGSLQWSSSTSPVVFSWIGAGITDDHHDLSHKSDLDTTAQAQLTAIHTWYSQQFAYLLGKLDAMAEAGGSVLDHSVVLWGNELGKGNVHSHDHVPFVFAGSGAGYFRTGRFVDTQGASHANLLVSCLNALDVPATSFGNPAYCSGPMANLR